MRPVSSSKKPKSKFIKLTSQIFSLTSVTPPSVAGERLAEVDLALPDANPTAVSDDNGAVVEGVLHVV
jgi:hypothetical protein